MTIRPPLEPASIRLRASARSRACQRPYPAALLIGLPAVMKPIHPFDLAALEAAAVVAGSGWAIHCCDQIGDSPP